MNFLRDTSFPLGALFFFITGILYLESLCCSSLGSSSVWFLSRFSSLHSRLTIHRRRVPESNFTPPTHYSLLTLHQTSPKSPAYAGHMRYHTGRARPAGRRP